MAQPKRAQNFAQAALYTVVVVCILVAVNYLANRYNKSFDTTSNKRYTLSDQTQKLAGELTQDVTISYWNRATDFPQAHDLLDRRIARLDRFRQRAAANVGEVGTD